MRVTLLRVALLLVAIAVAAVLPPALAEEDFAHSTNTDSNSVYVRTQSLVPPYVDDDFNNRWFDFGGSTVIKPNSYVRLTPDLQGRTGWIAGRVPFFADMWTIDIAYRIHGRGMSLFGDGFAFWFLKDKFEPATDVFGGKSVWNGLSIVFDTYDNGKHGYTYPYVAALMNDGTKTYQKATDGKELEIGGCQADIRSRPHTMRARIRYSKGKYLKMELNTKGWDEWTTCFNVPNVVLPNPGWMALSAETGGLSDNHDIYGVHANQLIKDDQKTHEFPAKKDTWDSDMYGGQQSHGPSFKTIFVVLLLIAAAIFGGIKYMDATKGRHNYKHF